MKKTQKKFTFKYYKIFPFESDCACHMTMTEPEFIKLYDNSHFLQVIAKLIKHGCCSQKIKPIKKFDSVPKNFLKIFTPEFLVHLKTTHGISPDMFKLIIKEPYSGSGSKVIR